MPFHKFKVKNLIPFKYYFPHQGSAKKWGFLHSLCLTCNGYMIIAKKFAMILRTGEKLGLFPSLR
ncbi:MAG: hypothetical protein AN484_27970, partial [Aphanizomenon flos-aquae WA102]